MWPNPKRILPHKEIRAKQPLVFGQDFILCARSSMSSDLQVLEQYSLQRRNYKGIIPILWERKYSFTALEVYVHVFKESERPKLLPAPVRSLDRRAQRGGNHTAQSVYIVDCITVCNIRQKIDNIITASTEILLMVEFLQTFHSKR